MGEPSNFKGPADAAGGSTTHPSQLPLPTYIPSSALAAPLTLGADAHCVIRKMRHRGALKGPADAGDGRPTHLLAVDAAGYIVLEGVAVRVHAIVQEPAAGASAVCGVARGQASVSASAFSRSSAHPAKERHWGWRNRPGTRGRGRSGLEWCGTGKRECQCFQLVKPLNEFLAPPLPRPPTHSITPSSCSLLALPLHHRLDHLHHEPTLPHTLPSSVSFRGMTGQPRCGAIPLPPSMRLAAIARQALPFLYAP